MKLYLSYIFWDPPRVAFTIPYIDHPIVWYSLLFAGGFFAGYLLAARLTYGYLHDKKATFSFLDKLAWYIFVGMIVGARLGHVFFYEWPYYKAHPIEILFTWEGGLSSHGAAIGLILAILLFWKNPAHRPQNISFKRLLDILTVAAAFVACAIRLGNFMNQEILGTPSDLPFSVWFGHPAEAGATMPCHPVQLYEALFYLLTGTILYKIFNKLGDGKTAGLFFLLVFTFRFFIEFLKLPQGTYDSSWFLSMGQLLSIPFILLGLRLLNPRNPS